MSARNRPPRRSITVQLSPAIVERLDAACRERQVGRGVIIDRAIGQFLDRLLPVEDVLATPKETTDA
jgi:predicted transcriptional regulator